jgi:RimJ/RimL family protein N-acetyltransferase
MAIRISIRRLKEADIYRLQTIVKKDIATLAQIEWPFNREAALNFIINYNTWGIFLNEGILVGAIEVKETCETAYLIAHQYQNKGIATEAVKLALIEFGDSQLWCVVSPDNVASIRVAQKANMRMNFI